MLRTPYGIKIVREDVFVAKNAAVRDTLLTRATLDRLYGRKPPNRFGAHLAAAPCAIYNESKHKRPQRAATIISHTIIRLERELRPALTQVPRPQVLLDLITLLRRSTLHRPHPARSEERAWAVSIGGLRSHPTDLRESLFRFPGPFL